MGGHGPFEMSRPQQEDQNCGPRSCEACGRHFGVFWVGCGRSGSDEYQRAASRLRWTCILKQPTAFAISEGRFPRVHLNNPVVGRAAACPRISTIPFGLFDAFALALLDKPAFHLRDLPSTVSTMRPILPRVETCGSSTVTTAPFCSHSWIRLSTSRVSGRADQTGYDQFVIGTEEIQHHGQFCTAVTAVRVQLGRA